MSTTCPSCGADRGTVGVVEKTLCSTCLAREGIVSIPKGATMTKEEAQLPRQIIQLVPAGDRLFCMCDDRTVWEWTARDAPKYRWVNLPKPGLPTPIHVEDHG